MMLPLISVIVPVYKVEELLHRCVDSILSQTYNHLEVILVDDGSPDRCGSICDDYAKRDARVQVIHKKNGGSSEARNVGLDIMQGEYVTFVDSDDYIDADCIEYLYALLKKFDCNFSLCLGCGIFSKTGKIEAPVGTAQFKLPTEEYLRRMLYDQDHMGVNPWAKLYHCSLFEQVRFPVGKLFEDTATNHRLALQCPYIACGLEQKYKYYIHSNSNVTSTFSSKKMDLLWATDLMCEEILAVYPNLARATIRRKVYANFSTLIQTLTANPRVKNVEKELYHNVKKNTKHVLRNPDAPKRDKVAIIILLCLGINAFRFACISYLKLTKRQ